jgi:hypothetical protein
MRCARRKDIGKINKYTSLHVGRRYRSLHNVPIRRGLDATPSLLHLITMRIYYPLNRDPRTADRRRLGAVTELRQRFRQSLRIE